MYIVPNSDIYLLKNVPLDPTYDHTLWFVNAFAQHSYFNTKVKYTFTNNTYVRPSTGKLRVPQNVENVYDCNYLMFRNPRSAGDGTTIYKWFYCFISNPVYINENVTEIDYEIDDMQTWFFDYELETCFVEREHTESDEIGEHIMTEPIANGALIGSEIYTPADFRGDNMFVVVYSTYSASVTQDQTTGDWTATLTPGNGGLHDGIYTGVRGITVRYDPADLSDVSEAINKINAVIYAHTTGNKSDSIVAIYTIPQTFLDGVSSAIDNHPSSSTAPTSFSFDIPESNVTGWSYTYNGKSGPRNNKLKAYPYTYLSCTNGSEEATYQIEYFPKGVSGYAIRFQVQLSMQSEPTGRIVPYGYMGVGNNAKNYNFAMQLNSLPQCSYIIDTYRAWLAQNKTASIIGIGAGAAKLGVEIAAGVASKGQSVFGEATFAQGGVATRGATRALNGVESILANVNNWAVARTMGNQMLGKNTNVLDVSANLLGFRFFGYHPRPEYAATIDDFFDRYGYSVNALKVPNRHVRENWTYTKTSDCTIKGTNGLPAEAALHICDIYNNGITFWQGTTTGVDHVGDYSLSNRPLSEVSP